MPVEGELARPSLLPLLGLPFGGEWTLDVPAVFACTNFRASLRTHCIDVTAPHRGCQWALGLRPGEAEPRGSTRPLIRWRPKRTSRGERTGPAAKLTLRRRGEAAPPMQRRRPGVAVTRLVVAACLLLLASHGPITREFAAPPAPVVQSGAVPQPHAAVELITARPPRPVHAATPRQPAPRARLAQAAHASQTSKPARAHAAHPAYPAHVDRRAARPASASLPDEIFTDIDLPPVTTRAATPRPQIDWAAHLTQRRLTEDAAFLR